MLPFTERSAPLVVLTQRVDYFPILSITTLWKKRTVECTTHEVCGCWGIFIPVRIGPIIITQVRMSKMNTYELLLGKICFHGNRQ